MSLQQTSAATSMPLGTATLEMVASAYAHSNLRCQERYGVGIKKKEYEKLCSALDSGTEPFVEWLLKLKNEWHAVVLHRGQRCRVVWHPQKKIIRSFLPPLA